MLVPVYFIIKNNTYYQISIKDLKLMLLFN